MWKENIIFCYVAWWHFFYNFLIGLKWRWKRKCGDTVHVLHVVNTAWSCMAFVMLCCLPHFYIYIYMLSLFVFCAWDSLHSFLLSFLKHFLMFILFFKILIQQFYCACTYSFVYICIWQSVIWNMQMLLLVSSKRNSCQKWVNEGLQ